MLVHCVRVARARLLPTAQRLPQFTIRSLCDAPGNTSNEQVQRALTLLDEGQVVKAIKEFNVAAADGDAQANFYLGLAYDNLLGSNARGEPHVEPNPEAAFRCYLRAAEGGHPEAMLNLSFCYRNGEGVEQDIRTAFHWLESSAGAGSARALFNAGRR